MDENINIEIRPHHIGLSVPDMEASIKWYHDVLGCSIARQIDMGEDRGKMTMMKLGDFQIELFEVPGSRPSADLQTKTGQDLALQGTKHIAFIVKDMDVFKENLKKRGVELPAAPTPPAGGPPPGGPPPGTPRNLFLRDNSGIMLEFVPETTIQKT